MRILYHLSIAFICFFTFEKMESVAKNKYFGIVLRFTVHESKNNSPHVRDSTTVLDSGFHTSRYWIPDFRSEKFVDSGIRIRLHGAKIMKNRLLMLHLTCSLRRTRSKARVRLISLNVLFSSNSFQRQKEGNDGINIWKFPPNIKMWELMDWFISQECQV